MIEYFPKPRPQMENVKVLLDLSNYATKSDLKSMEDTSKFAKKVDLACLKSEIGKLEITPVDLSTLSDVVKNNVVKKSKYDELFKNVNAIKTIVTSDLV